MVALRVSFIGDAVLCIDVDPSWPLPEIVEGTSRILHVIYVHENSDSNGEAPLIIYIIDEMVLPLFIRS
jgi:hypothetical protein